MEKGTLFIGMGALVARRPRVGWEIREG